MYTLVYTAESVKGTVSEKKPYPLAMMKKEKTTDPKKYMNASLFLASSELFGLPLIKMYIFSSQVL